MKSLLSLLLLFGLAACNNAPEEMKPKKALPKEEIIKLIIKDSTFSGLVDLPQDNGGEHIAYTLTSESDFGLGHYVYTPGAYNDNTLDYPLILFLHGSGQRGNNYLLPHQIDLVLKHGPSFLIERDEWNPTYPCIVVSPQTDGDWQSEAVHDFIEYLIETYRINPKRIYLTGLSMGGHGCWTYEGEKGAESYAAAMVPICGRGRLSYVENLARLPIWAFHGEEDDIVDPFYYYGSSQMVSLINSNDPLFEAKLTMYPEVGHNSWKRTYDNTGMGTENEQYDPFAMTIYDWLFQFRKE